MAGVFAERLADSDESSRCGMRLIRSADWKAVSARSFRLICETGGRNGEFRMKWYARLYVGAALQKGARKKEVMRRAEKGEAMPGVYLLLLPEGKANQLEILPMFFFQRRFPDGASPLIVGIAFGRKEAQTLLVQIAQEVYDRTGGADIRGYLTGEDGLVREQ